MTKNFILKISFLFLTGALLYLGFNLFYNQSKEATAQTERTPHCEIEIPVGKTIDETEELGGKIVEDLGKIQNNSWSEAQAARQLVYLAFADPCNGDALNAQINEIEKFAGETEKSAGEIDSLITNKDLITTVDPVTGTVISYEWLTKREQILKKLNEARTELRKCVLSPEEIKRLERGEEVRERLLLRCEAVLHKGWWEKPKPCYENNYVCCE